MVDSQSNLTEMPLEDCMDAIIDYRGKTPKKTSHGIPLVTAKIIKGGRVMEPAEFIAPSEYDDWMRRGIPEPGDLVMTTEAPLGEVAQLDDRKIALAQRVITLRGKSDLLDNTYLKYLLISEPIQNRLKSRASGTTVLGTKQSELRKVKLSFPPLPEQRAIASILGALDDKIELNRRMNATLESLARAIFKSWFVEFDPVKINAGQMPASSHGPKVLDLFPSNFQNSELGPIPEGWNTCVFDDFTDFVIGGDWGKETLQDDFVEEVRCIRGADIPGLQDGGVGKMPTRFIKSNSLNNRSLLAGHLAFEISGGSPTQSTGRPVLITQTFLDRIPTRVTCSNFCRFIRLKESVSPFYVYTMLRWLYDRDEFLQYENGTTGIKNLAFKRFGSTHQLLLPPEQLMNEFDRVASGYFEAIARHGAEAQRLAETRDRLLPQLLSGDLPVTSGWLEIASGG